MNCKVIGTQRSRVNVEADSSTPVGSLRLTAELRGFPFTVRRMLSRLDATVFHGDGWCTYNGFERWCWWECTVLITADEKTIRHCENILAEYGS